MAGPKTVELLGANSQSLRLTGAEATTSIVLDNLSVSRVTMARR